MHARSATAAWHGELMIMICQATAAPVRPGFCGPVISAPVNCPALAEFGPDDGLED